MLCVCVCVLIPQKYCCACTSLTTQGVVGAHTCTPTHDFVRNPTH